MLFFFLNKSLDVGKKQNDSKQNLWMVKRNLFYLEKLKISFTKIKTH